MLDDAGVDAIATDDASAIDADDDAAGDNIFAIFHMLLLMLIIFMLIRRHHAILFSSRWYFAYFSLMPCPFTFWLRHYDVPLPPFRWCHYCLHWVCWFLCLLFTSTSHISPYADAVATPLISFRQIRHASPCLLFWFIDAAIFISSFHYCHWCFISSVYAVATDITHWSSRHYRYWLISYHLPYTCKHCSIRHYWCLNIAFDYVCGWCRRILMFIIFLMRRWCWSLCFAFVIITILLCQLSLIELLRLFHCLFWCWCRWWWL